MLKVQSYKVKGDAWCHTVVYETNVYWASSNVPLTEEFILLRDIQIGEHAYSVLLN